MRDMSANLEILAAQAVYAASLFERAVHDPGPWTMSYAGQTVPARRTLTERSVVFVASFADVCFIGVPDPTVTLECRGEVVSLRQMVAPGDGGFDLSWVIDAQVVPVA